jgi:hypothetical protein
MTGTPTTSPATLQQLRDIHLPAPIGWWPPAPGWWMLLALLIAIIVGSIFWTTKYRQKNRYRRLALQQLHALRASEQHDSIALEQSVNRLLKQTALAAYPRQRVAALNGADWLIFLDSGLKQPRFSEPALRALATTYQAEPQAVSPEVLFGAAEYWIRRHRC